MIFGYKRASELWDEYWYTLIDGQERKYSRMVAGAALPIFDRMSGALVVIGEAYRPGGVQDFTVFGAGVGNWGDIEREIAQYREDLKFGRIIVQDEPTRDLLRRRVRALHWGSGEVPCLSDVAPAHSLGEVTRSDVDDLIAQGRLRIPTQFINILAQEKELAKIAMHSAISWMRYYPKIYKAIKRNPQRGRIAGTTGL